MPTITSQARPVPVADESSWRAPTKTITQSTGMDVKKSFSGAPVETKPEDNRQKEVAEETKPEQITALSPQLAALARKEAKFRQQEQAFKAEQAKLEAERAEIAELKALKTKLEAKDFSDLEKYVPYDAYTQFLIDKGDANKPETQAIKKLEDEVKAIKTATEQNVTKQYEATVAQYKRDIKNLVESDPAYDSIKTQNAEEHVLQHILDTFNAEGEILTIEQAAKDIEDAIVEEAMSYTKLKKVQDAMSTKQEKSLPPPKQPMKTLTNQVTQVTSSTPRNQLQFLTMKERIAEAVRRSQK